MSEDDDQSPFDHPLFSRLFGLGDHKPPSEEQLYQSHKGFLTPSWREVNQKSEVFAYFASFAKGIVSHCITCTNPECPSNNTLAVFMTPELFTRLVIERLKSFSGEASDLVDMWLHKDIGKILIDPRYVVFRCFWDTAIVGSSIMRECVQDPFKSVRDDIE